MCCSLFRHQLPQSFSRLGNGTLWAVTGTSQYLTQHFYVTKSSLTTEQWEIQQKKGFNFLNLYCGSLIWSQLEQRSRCHYSQLWYCFLAGSRHGLSWFAQYSPRTVLRSYSHPLSRTLTANAPCFLTDQEGPALLIITSMHSEERCEYSTNKY
jgi:hypothetical protein